MTQILQGDCREVLKTLPDQSVQCCVTSPPYYGLRDYNCKGQLGLEKSPGEYVDQMVQVFTEVKRVLKDDGTLWLNLGDSYSGSGKARGGGGNGPTSAKQVTNAGAYFNSDMPIHADGCKPKDLIGIPWMVAFALRDDGWWLRSDIIWHKPNPMPESVTDRPTKSHEYLFLMAKSQTYYYDAEAIKEQSEEASGWAKQRANGKNTWEYNDTESRVAQTGQRIEASTFGAEGSRNKRSVWTVATNPYPEAHFATFPPDLIKPCVMAGSRFGDTVLDPFGGSGTTGQVALELGRKAILIELNPDYIELINQRTNVTPAML